MPNNEEILTLGKTVIREVDHFGRGSQFVGYVNTTLQDGTEHVFVTRGPVHPSMRVSSGRIQYVRYRLPLGRIAEVTPGKVAVVRVQRFAGLRPLGIFDETEYTILARDLFRLQSDEGVTDAVENQITFPDGTVFIPALRSWINRTAEEIAADAAKPRRRRIAERFELADLPVVDQAQGEVWRSNIRRFIVITGAPGTGKTTTSIKRIAHKTDETALIEGKEVTGIAGETLRAWFQGPRNWTLFTPSDLLRSYLQQALGQEGLAATEERVPVWGTTKVRIARDVLRVIGQDRFFSLAESLVATADSKSLSVWAVGFREYFEKRIHEELRRAILEQASLLEETLRDLHHPALVLWRDVAVLGNIKEGERLGQTLRGVLALKARLQQFLEKNSEQTWTESERARLQTVIADAKDVLSKFTDDAYDSIDSVLRKLPVVYQEYRLRASEGGRFYRHDAMGAVNDRRIDPLELDGLIYVSLLILRESFAGREPEQRFGGVITQRLANEFRYVVAVDEATDFSAVELACMRLLAHPVFDCVTFAGDPMQRMTKHGINDWQEISDLVEPPELHELRFSYRQSKKLLQIAAKLFEASVGRPAPFEAGFGGSSDDPDALRCQVSSHEGEADWLMQRIGEIYKICGQLLPSIAVLVPAESDVRPLADFLRKPLREAYGIETEACSEGRILGTQAKVRVFSVEFIKGLEFEAVFFVGADRMAMLTPGLVDRFIYVGLSRARSFLAITTHGEFPSELAHVEPFFRQGTWQHLL